MAKEDQSTEPTSAPEVDTKNIDSPPESIAEENPVDSSEPLLPDQTIEEAEKAAEPAEDPSDEDIYKEAASEIVNETPSSKEIKPKKGKKWLIVLLVLLILGGGVAGAWYFLIKNKPVEQSQQTTTPETTESASTLTYVPESVAYAFRASDDVPYTLFLRPSAGGEREQAQILENRDAIISSSDVHGLNVAFVANEDVYVSKDGGKSYAVIYDSPAGAQVTDVKFSQDGSKIAVGTLAESAGKNVLKTMSIDGSESADVYTSKVAGVFVLGWNNQRAILKEGCFNCGGYNALPTVLNLANGENKELFKADLDKTTRGHTVSPDISTILYVEGAVGEEFPGGGSALVAPHKVSSLNIDSREVSVLTTIGKEGEKNTNGTTKSRNIAVGFIAGTSSPYYTDGEKTLYKLSEGKSVALYESETNILSVVFVGNNDVIVTNGNNESDYALTNYSPENKKSTVIFQGDANTVIFGVTTN